MAIGAVSVSVSVPVDVAIAVAVAFTRNEQRATHWQLHAARWSKTSQPCSPIGCRSFQIYEKHDALLHGPRKNNKDKRVSLTFLKKYIHLARQVKPTLTAEACQVISAEYPRLRSFDSEHSDMARVTILAHFLPKLYHIQYKHITHVDASPSIHTRHAQ